jgi:hypothetical protein
MRLAAGAALFSLALAAAAQQPIAFPAKGQSAQQQHEDTAECQARARQSTGFDPAAAGASSPDGGERLRGALGGAAPGGVYGGITDHAGQAAAAGAAVGPRAGEEQRATRQRGPSPPETLDRAFAACMSGRGYTIR